jgi:hypothetical protein
MSRKDQLLRILAALDGHFAADDCSPADADRWRQLKRHIVRMKDALDLARIELDRKAPEPSNALKHVRWGLGVEDKMA